MLVISCINMGSGTINEIDPGALPATVTYEAHLKPLLAKHCTECHSSDGRFGIQDGYDYGTYALSVAYYAALKQAAIDEKSMPPGTKERLSSLEAALVLKWQTDGLLEK